MRVKELIGDISLVGPNSVNYSKKLPGLFKPTVHPAALKAYFSGEVV